MQDGAPGDYRCRYRPDRWLRWARVRYQGQSGVLQGDPATIRLLARTLSTYTVDPQYEVRYIVTPAVSPIKVRMISSAIALQGRPCRSAASYRSRRYNAPATYDYSTHYGPATFGPSPTDVLVPSTRTNVPVTVPSILPTQAGVAPTFLPQSFLDLLASFNRSAPRAMQEGGAVLDKAADDFLEALKVA